MLAGKGAGVEMGLHGDAIQSSVQAGLVALPSLAHSQTGLEVAVVGAVIEAVVHDMALFNEVSSCPMYAQVA